jgi:uncharacterized oxidoreductase
MEITPTTLRKIASAIIQKTGSTPKEAWIVSDHLVRANLSGHDSHGVGILPTYIRNYQAGLLRPNTSVRLVKDNGSIMMFDGLRGYGQRTATEAMELAIKRCKEIGLVMFTLRNAHHLGRIGTYGEQAITAGSISLHFVNVTDHDPRVAPFRGSDARFSTNPLCIAIPGSEESAPILLDMATSGIAVGKTRVAYNKGEQVEDGKLIDHEGKPTNDPRVMWDQPYGALLPFGEHKGYGLALCCEVLAGVLGGGGTIQPGNRREGSIINSMMAFVIDPERLVERSWLNHEVAETVTYFKGSPPVDPSKPVLVAGEPERLAAQERAGAISMDDRTWEAILAAGEQIGFDPSIVNTLLSSSSGNRDNP